MTRHEAAKRRASCLWPFPMFAIPTRLSQSSNQCQRILKNTAAQKQIQLRRQGGCPQAMKSRKGSPHHDKQKRDARRSRKCHAQHVTHCGSVKNRPQSCSCCRLRMAAHPRKYGFTSLFRMTRDQQPKINRAQKNQPLQKIHRPEIEAKCSPVELAERQLKYG